MADASVDSIVTDPPYGLSFMGKRWDYDVPSEAIWRECLRVLKPGGHLLAFAGTRTQHRMAVRIEDAGFEIRDMIAWVYGSGFPKSHNLGNGWGTALKPALEPITMARKPFKGTVAANVLEHGAGALNVDGCRVAYQSTDDMEQAKVPQPSMNTTGEIYNMKTGIGRNGEVFDPSKGRWPANLIHDGSEEVVGLFPQTKAGVAVRHNSGGNTFGGENPKPPMEDMGYGDSGSAARFFQRCVREEDETSNLEHFLQAVAAPAYSDSNLESLLLTYQRQAKELLSDNSNGAPPRFFYCAKASKADRDEGCEGMDMRGGHMASKEGGGGGWKADADKNPNLPRANYHPTVKPTALMRYLCRLVTPPSGTVLDPFMGSGSTGKAAVLEGFNFIGIEREAEYVEIAKARIAAAEAERAQSLPLEA